MVMKACFTTLFCTIFSMVAFAQFEAKDSLKPVDSKPSVIISNDVKLDLLEEQYEEFYELVGYRVQIFSGNKKQPAREVQSKFTRLYSKTKAHSDYHAPNFRVRVGDFRTKLEAVQFQKEIQKHFPDCYIVKDVIDPEQLMK